MPYGRRIVRYAGMHPYARRASRAYTTARFIYNNRRTVGRAARVIQKAYRRRSKLRSGRHKRAREFAEPAGRETAKKRIIANQQDNNENTRTLYNLEISGIAQGPDTDERLQNKLKLVGYRFNMKIINRSTKHLLFNVAIVSPKNATGMTTDDFFRGYGTTRGLDFSGTNMNSTDFHWRPINTDNYHIFKHKRFTLIKDANTIRPWWKELNFYIPIKRQVRYDNQTLSQAETPLYLLYWCDELAGVTGTAVTTAAFSMQYNIFSFFRTPKVS